MSCENMCFNRRLFDIGHGFYDFNRRLFDIGHGFYEVTVYNIKLYRYKYFCLGVPRAMLYFTLLDPTVLNLLSF